MSDMNIIDKVSNYHGGQTWGGFDYTFHLSSVVSVASHFSDSDRVQVLALFHDLIEDTAATVDDVAVMTPSGMDVADGVVILSRNLSQGDDTYQEYICRVASCGDRDVVIVKLSDAITNYGLCRYNGSSLVSRYRESIPVLWNSVVGDDVDWDRVDDLADSLFR